MKLTVRRYGVLLPLMACLFSVCMKQGFSQQAAMTKLEFETGVFQQDEEPVEIAEFETGAAVLLGEHFRIAADIAVSMDNALDFFHANEAKKKPADLELSMLALEFPFFAAGQAFTPVLFSGHYMDRASGDLLVKTLRTDLRKPLFVKRGPMSVFSDESLTTGLGAALIWRAKTAPVVAAAYGAWNAETDRKGFQFSAQTAGAGETLRWNLFAGAENGANLAGGRDEITADDDIFLSAGLSAEAGADRTFSLYLQAQILPFKMEGGETLAKSLEKKAHFLMEPRFQGERFYFSAAFFLSPVMRPRTAPYLDINEDGQYIGLNLRLSCGNLSGIGSVFGFDFAAVSELDDDNGNSGGLADHVTVCISPFFSAMLKSYVFTLSLSVNPDRLDEPLSAGEINLHIEAAL